MKTGESEADFVLGSGGVSGELDISIRPFVDMAHRLPSTTDMAYRRQCPKCRRVGFVRAERVFRWNATRTELFCSACSHHWEERDLPASDPPASEEIPKKKD